MALFYEIYVRQLNKWGEELCGDNVNIVRSNGVLTAAVADGLGSGVKANILSTLTTKIAVSMLSNGADTDEVISTIAETLPVCRQRDLAYSTISILQLRPEGRGYLAEFDCPEVMLIREGSLETIKRNERVIAGKTVRESHFDLCIGDTILLLTDGVIHAGVGASLNMGWQWNNVASYIANLAKKNHSLWGMVSSLSNTCGHLYAGKPGDDTTVVGIRVMDPQPVVILTGPPRVRDLDKVVVDSFMASRGTKVICGGATAQMVARETGVKMATELSTMADRLPPIAEMKGIDLVTEGILTLSAALSIIRTFANSQDDLRDSEALKRPDGASRLANILVNKSTHVRLMVGGAVNDAYLEYMPVNVGFRKQLAEDLTYYLEQMGKEVEVEYY